MWSVQCSVRNNIYTESQLRVVWTDIIPTNTLTHRQPFVSRESHLSSPTQWTIQSHVCQISPHFYTVSLYSIYSRGEEIFFLKCKKVHEHFEFELQKKLEFDISKLEHWKYFKSRILRYFTFTNRETPLSYREQRGKLFFTVNQQKLVTCLK